MRDKEVKEEKKEVKKEVKAEADDDGFVSPMAPEMKVEVKKVSYSVFFHFHYMQLWHLPCIHSSIQIH